MDFSIHSPTEIRFGRGRICEAAACCSAAGGKVCLVTGAHPERVERLRKDLEDAGLAPSLVTISGEPSTETAASVIEQARSAGCDCVVSVGGGSVLDTGKVIAAFLTNEGELLDYLEGVGRGNPLQHRAALHVAMPTTSGTGAEVTKNSVLSVKHERVKVSMRSTLMLPHVALIDPDLTLGLPPPETAASGLDALTQLLEAYITPFANPFTDGLCREGLLRAGRSIRRVYTHPDDEVARGDMALAATFSGVALAQAKLGAVHGIAGPLGGMYEAPHGAVCARLLAPVLRMNLSALRSREPASEALTRIRQAGRWLTGLPDIDPDGTADWIELLCADLEIPPLQTWGVKEGERDELIAKSKSSSSMKGNPIRLEDAELRNILEAAH
jgi:alcohol dehydrogenase class IV